jgi:hypothetical protein
MSTTTGPLPDPKIVPAFLLAIMRGDAADLGVVLGGSAPWAMCVALAAWINARHGRADFEDEAAYVAYLQNAAATMAGPPPDDPS